MGFKDSLLSTVILETTVDSHHLSIAPETFLIDAIDLISQGRSSCTLQRLQEPKPSVSLYEQSAVKTRLNLSRRHQTAGGYVLVMNQTKLAGLLTERDLVKFVAKGMKLEGVTVADVMAQHFIRLFEADFQDIFTVLNLFHQHRIRYLPLVKDTGQLLGIITPDSIEQVVQPTDILRLRRVVQVMTTKVIHTPLTTSVQDLAKLMVKHRISCVVIAQEQEVVEGAVHRKFLMPLGIVTERDIVQIEARGRELDKLSAQNVISSPLACVSPEDSLWVAYQRMRQLGQRQLLVSGVQGELVGILTQTSLLRSLNPLDIPSAIQDFLENVAQQVGSTAQPFTLFDGVQAKLTERQQTELELEKVNQALGRSIATNRALLSALPDLILRISRDGTLVNYKAGKDCQMALPIYQYLGKSLHKVFPVEVAALAMSCVERALRTGDIQSIEYQMTLSDRLHDYEARFAVSDTDEVMAIMRDITERKQAEAALRASEERFRATFEQAAVGIVHTGLDGRFLRVNRKFCDIVGYTHAQLCRKTFIDITHPEDIDADQRYVEQLLAGEIETFSMEKRYYSKNSSLIWVNLTGSLVRKPSGEVDYFVGVVEDISDRKSAERALQESEQRYRSVVESVKEVIFQTDTKGLWTFLNPAWTEITGFTISESMGKKFFDYIHVEDRQECLELFQQFIEGQKRDWRREIRFLTKEGNFHWIDALVRIVFNTDGTIFGMSGTLYDITERKQVEEKLRKALEQEKELNELKSRFVSMTSHEFRTPLTSILGSTELLRYYSHTWSEDKKIVHFNRIQTNVQHMTQMLNDILLLGKAEAGKLSLQSTPLDIVQFCSSLVEEFQLGTGSGHEIIFSHQGKCLNSNSLVAITENFPVFAYLDEKLLRHIFGNLLSNAIKYSSLGSTINFEITAHEGEAIVRIQDEGIGIPSEEQQHLFESFYRAKNVGKLPGTGLGLAIVKKSVDLHGGRISVSSQVGVGTTFTVYLPLNKES
ncbi:PAS domain S-box protein [Lyngbya aestuarii]|uniref:PAS domain S-box protein n=1 Tax=Lyngbya aestuarii TaxID=118322 RepID=UPI00403D5742